MKKILLAAAVAQLSTHASAELVLTGVFDATLPGGIPKGVELYVSSDIPDLSIYGLESANNGNAASGAEFTFPAVPASAGEYIYVGSEEPGFVSFLGFAPDYTSGALSINGDDAIIVYQSGVIHDVFGEVGVDGTGANWEYLDGWAYRQPGAAASESFAAADWQFSGANALDGASDNASAASPIPLATYSSSGGGSTDNPAPQADRYLISQVQGNPDSYGSNQFGEQDVSPIIGQQVEVEGIVVGDFQDGDADDNRNLSGFYLQEESTDEDDNALSSEGVFIYDSSFGVDVQLGDKVRVVGTVDQYFGETQIDSVSVVEVLDTAQLQQVTPAVISLLSSNAVTTDQNGNYQPDLEAYEGMLVSIADTLTLSEQFQLDRFNEVKLVAGERPYQFTQLNVPDALLYDQALQTLGARRITYDDGLNQQNAEISLLDGFASYNEANAKRMGDTVTGLTGVLDYKWAGNSASGATWRLRSHLDGSNVFTSTAAEISPNPRPLAPPAITGDLKVASFNVLNFFDTLDESGVVTAIGMDPRGADSQTEFDRQQLKLVNAIMALDADVLGLVELENDFDPVQDGSTAIEVLVNALNAELGAAVYDYVYPGQQFVGTDAIAVGFIYKPAVVTIADGSSVALLDDSAAAQLPSFQSRDFAVDPIFDGVATNRVSAAISFSHLASGDVFTVVANHFKSKGASGLTDKANPNFDQQNGAGFWNQRRLDAAVAVTEWLATAPTGIDDEDIIILGDLNAYAMEEPVQYLLEHGFNNVEEPEAYSYVFDGQVGTLDYILVSDVLLEKFTAASLWHINSDEADALDYNLDFGKSDQYFDAETATRNSDHDPLMVGFELQPELTTIQHVIDIFWDGVADGSITGRGKNSLVSTLHLYHFYLQLGRAKLAESRGQAEKSCRLLQRAEQFSDGQGSPKDKVQGESVEDLNKLIIKATEDLGCDIPYRNQ